MKMIMMIIIIILKIVSFQQANVTLSWLQTETVKDGKGHAKSGGTVRTASAGVTNNQENKRKAIVFSDKSEPPIKRGNGATNGANHKTNRQLYQAPRGGNRFRSNRW